MRYDAIVFDFDGTLVQSVDAKAKAFFDIFPSAAGYRSIVAAVLAEDPDGSRARVIPMMWQRMVDAGLALPEGQNPDDRIAAYGEEVLARVAACPEMPGATDLLRDLHGKLPVYVASNTFEAPLKILLEQRGWMAFLTGAYGYPHRKAEVLEIVIQSCLTLPDRVMMVGDGPSDADAAARCGSAFFHIRGPEALSALAKVLNP